MVGVSIFMVRKGVKAKNRSTRHLPAHWRTRAGATLRTAGAERCVMLMLNEAVRCLDEQVSVACVTGILVRYLALVFRHSRWTVPLYRFSRRRRSGCNNQRLATQYGSRFTPCDRLVEIASVGKVFGKQLQLTCNKKVKLYESALNGGVLLKM